MIHPMLMPREPAPEIDVSKPALPKKAQASECAPTPTIERLEPMWLGIDPAQPGGDDAAAVMFSVKAGRLEIKDIDLQPGTMIYTRYWPETLNVQTPEWIKPLLKDLP